MYGKLTISGKEVEFVANGATVYRYKQIFRRDYFREISNADALENVDIFTRIGFVMAMQAKKADMSKLNEESFFEWLEQFDFGAVEGATADIATIFTGSEASTVDPKNEAAD